jgi:hypothetical protein
MEKYYRISESSLKQLRKNCSAGISPLVEYNSDPNEMLKNAYNKRGEMLIAIESVLLEMFPYLSLTPD